MAAKERRSADFNKNRSSHSQMDKLNRRAKRRRRLRIIQFSFLAVIVLIIAAIVINLLVVVKNMTVENNTPYSTDELLNQMGYHTGSGLYSINSEKALKLLSDKYPYIKSVSVQQHFPTGVSICFEKGAAVFCVTSSDGKYVYLNQDLKVLQIADEADAQAVSVLGITVDQAVVGQVIENSSETMDVELLQEVYDGVVAEGLQQQLTEIDLTKNYDVKLTVNGLISIEIGTSENIQKKLQTAKLILQRNDPTKKARINVKNFEQGRYTELETSDSGA